MPEEELESWIQSQNRKLWAFKVSDKFGDMGLSGLVSLEIEGQFGKIIDFVLSCRIMGRMVEESMLYVVAKYAQSEKLKELIAEYISTPKNTPCLEFWKKKSKFLYNEPQNIFSLKINGKYPKPDCVQLEGIQE